ncbi:hypothetical protein [Allomuricauda sp. SCSIO 65647]|uniref:hypothetical protein n=1 Tax=Allomuricauda sp. SCSIO 65647 TaxID=2908843 RepID=UPI001F288D78|nr:hypothetical protein [Muricauda sp. SCSIO 65647]UJH66460.1 hypothetical protein L0P89_10820 [Muricauda sp. SCSIO 65647]
MKTYKIKSLIYFGCFLMASFLYYGIEQYDRYREFTMTNNVAEIESTELDTAKPDEDLDGSKDLVENR